MGQHRYNPTAIAAKNGEIPPKPKRPSKRQTEFAMIAAMENAMRKHIGLAPSDLYDYECTRKWI